MFKDRFKILRTSNRYTQSEMAEYLDVSVQAVYNWEKGIFIPNIDTLIAIADFFDVSLDYLLCRDNKKYIEVNNLSNEQVVHIQQLINDLRENK